MQSVSGAILYIFNFIATNNFKLYCATLYCNFELQCNSYVALSVILSSNFYSALQFLVGWQFLVGTILSCNFIAGAILTWNFMVGAIF